MQRCQCQINDSTLKGFVWSSMNCLSMFLFLKNGYFQLWFPYKSGLRISPTGKHLGIVRIKNGWLWKTSKFSTLLILSRLYGGSFEITLRDSFRHFCCNFKWLPIYREALLIHNGTHKSSLIKSTLYINTHLHSLFLIFVKKQSQGIIILMVIISLELTRVNPDRNIFSINVELISTFLIYRGLVHHHHQILNLDYNNTECNWTCNIMFSLIHWVN